LFLHLGGELSVLKKDVVGIFDYYLLKKSKITKEFLEVVDSEGCLDKKYDINKIKSFIVTQRKIYLSPISSITLQKRMMDYNYSQEDNEE
jgi:hypothetical protein